jgi:ribose transport system ATP-binding protein
MDCPTRGIDIGVKAAMYKLIYQLRQEGKSIVMISEELPELIGMSDRMIIMKDGKISAEIMRGRDVKDTQLIECMV